MNAAPEMPPLPRLVYGGIPLEGSPLLTTEQVADYIGLERSTIYDMLECGELEALRRVGKDKGHMRITRRSLVVNRALSSSRASEETIAVLVYAVRTLSEAQRRAFLAIVEKGARA